jgi:acyl carrier protein
MQQSLLPHFNRAPLSSSGKTGIDSGDDNFGTLFRQAETNEERSSIVVQFLAKRLARSLGIDFKDVNVEKPLHAYGVDSLVAVELRNWIAKGFAADVPVFELVSGRTVQGVAEFVEKCSQIKNKGQQEEDSSKD